MLIKWFKILIVTILCCVIFVLIWLIGIMPYHGVNIDILSNPNLVISMKPYGTRFRGINSVIFKSMNDIELWTVDYHLGGADSALEYGITPEGCDQRAEAKQLEDEMLVIVQIYGYWPIPCIDAEVFCIKRNTDGHYEIDKRITKKYKGLNLP